MSSSEAGSLLLVHGGPGMDDSYFFPYLDPLRSQVNLTSYVQRRAASLEDLIQELAKKIEDCSGGPVCVLAHSWGCMLTLETVRKRPDLHLDGLIFVSCGMDYSFRRDAENLRDRWARVQVNEPSDTEDEVFRKSCMESVGLYFSAGKLSEGLEVLGKISYSKKSIEAFFLEYILSFDLKRVLAGLSMPTLNVFGEKDFCVPAFHSAQIERLNPLIHNHEISGVGHFPFVEEPTAFCDAVLKFVRDL